jgi:methionyl-tRNA formyltransferase
LHGEMGVLPGRVCTASQSKANGEAADPERNSFDLGFPPQFCDWHCGWTCAGATPRKATAAVAEGLPRIGLQPDGRRGGTLSRQADRTDEGGGFPRPLSARPESGVLLRIVFFGSGGEGSMVPLETVSCSHQVIALVRPSRAGSWLRRTARFILSRTGIGARAVMAKWARIHDVPLLDATSGCDPELTNRLKRLAPDVICVSAFPWLLGGEILQMAGRAALNVHSSLLPRHRGPNPLLWIYYHSDRQTGVTVHGMDQRADAGAIFAQAAFDLPRGYPVDRLYARKALLGGELLLRVLDQLETGEAKPTTQEERLSTYAPRVAHGKRLVNFSEWDAERVWHFLSGLCPRRREPLWDGHQRKVRYKAVLGYSEENCGKAAGLVESATFGWNLYCRGGSVQLGDFRQRQSTAEP